MKNVFILLFAVLSAFPSLARVPEVVEQAQKDALIAWVSAEAGSQVNEKQSKRIVDAAYQYAGERELDVFLVLSIMRVESNFRENAAAKHGGRGLMQVIPYWHRDKLKGRSALNAHVNVEVGTKVLYDCKVRAKGNLLKTLSCYSGGGGQGYFAKVMKSHARLTRYAQESVFSQFVQSLSRDTVGT